jgi:hypothetical protein
MFTTKIKGKRFSCLYRLHGNRNVLKKHSGIVEKIGVGPNGLYVLLREQNGRCRTLLQSRMIDPRVVS